LCQISASGLLPSRTTVKLIGLDVKSWTNFEVSLAGEVSYIVIGVAVCSSGLKIGALGPSPRTRGNVEPALKLRYMVVEGYINQGLLKIVPNNPH